MTRPRDPVANAAARSAVHYDDTVIIAGTKIRVDRDTAKVFLTMLNVSENSAGEYIASLRDKPLESTGLPPASQQRPETWRAIADRSSARKVCDICGNVDRDRALAVDHDHKTGALRGYLCGHCNRGLGFFRDSPTLMRKGAEYIENPPGVPVARYISKIRPPQGLTRRYSGP